MKIGRKIKIWMGLDIATKLLLVEAFIFLGYARILKFLPFSMVVPLLGKKMDETSYNQNSSNMKILKNISQALHLMSQYTFWESQCLVKAIAGMKMLERRKIESTLYLGTSRDETGKMIAHAWLRSGSYYLSGSEGMKRFAVVGKFANIISSK